MPTRGLEEDTSRAATAQRARERPSGGAGGAELGAEEGEATLVPAPEGGSIEVWTRWEGPAPEVTAQRVSDPGCQRILGSTTIIPDDHRLHGDRLADVFVFVEHPPLGGLRLVPREPVILDQRGCRFVPKVLGVEVGQALEIRNSDPTLHNLGIFGGGQHFNLAMPKQGQVVTRRFSEAAGGIPIRSEINPLMTGTLYVMEHPYFGVSDRVGRVELRGLAPGRHTIVAAHARQGEQRRTIDLGTNPVSITFTFSADGASSGSAVSPLSAR